MLKILCPACGLRVVTRLETDWLECPEHGRFSTVTLCDMAGTSPLHALVDIRAEQYQREIHELARLHLFMMNYPQKAAVLLSTKRG